MSRRALIVAVAASLLMTGCQDAGFDNHPFDATAPPSPSDSGASGGAAPGEPQVVLKVEERRVSESSGLARSHRHPGVLYTHNDAGGAPEIFAIDTSGTRAVLTLDAAAVDWEDIASTPDGRLWIGDIGDNEEVRSSVSVSVLEEPAVLANTVLPSTTYRLRYPDGAHDAEALLVDPRTERLYVVTKEDGSGTVYAAPDRLSTEQVNLLEPVADAPLNVTAGDFSADGSLLVLRNQGRAFFYERVGGPPTVLVLPEQHQGESIVFDREATHVLVGSEGADSTVIRVPVPAQVVG